MQIAGLNTLDLLLIIILVIGILVGLVRGTIPQVISAASIWLALVATLWTYKIFSFRILQGLGIGTIVSDTIAFLVLLFVFFHAIRLIVKLLSTPPEERKKKRRKSENDPLAEVAKTATERFIIGPLNILGGMAMGLILTILWLALILGVAQFIFQPTDVAAGFSRRMTFQLTNSTLVPMFNSVLWLLARSVEFFVPRDADIFRRVLEFIS